MKCNPLSHPTGTTMRIGGQVVSKVAARYDYRCAECLSSLKYWNNGVACTEDVNHRGYIHKTEAARIAAEQAAQMAQVEADYEIRDGQIVPKHTLSILEEVPYADE